MGECTVNLKRGQVKIQTNYRDSLKRSAWDLRLSAVIVCILGWFSFLLVLD